MSSIRDYLCHPVKLIRLLEMCPDIRVSLDVPASCVTVERVVKWHEFGLASYRPWGRRKHRVLTGWRLRDKSSYGRFDLHRPELHDIGRCDVDEDWACDIGCVEWAASTSGSDHFYRYAWDGRVFIMNGGRAYDVAAAKHLASRLPAAEALHGKLHTFSLNARAIDSLRRDFEMFVIPGSTPFSLRFHDAMRAFGVTWLWAPMPRPFVNVRAILLPRSEARSMHVAELLFNASAADLGAHLAHLATLRT